jgi:threonine synthase
MSKFLDDFTLEELNEYSIKAYEKFENNTPCPLVNVEEGLSILELWHGPTHAFKDMALAVMPYLMTAAREKVGADKKSLILVATSGDTGKAALEGYKNVPGTFVMVFYPDSGVSSMQQMQMDSQTGDNVYVGSIRGNFDDAQSAVKKIFADKEIAEKLKDKGYILSSANSINIGRLIPQVAYYVSAYCDLLNNDELKYGEPVNFVVPSGNFGNILAAYYAKSMGLPIGKLICASNSNKVLTDFFVSGTYDIKKREFFKTMSPSMDILISSNLERLLYEILGRDSESVKTLMAGLKEEGRYTIDKLKLLKNASFFAAGFTTEEETLSAISNFFSDYDYVLDPHTAVAMNVYNNYVIDTNDFTPAVIVSTANPYKFPEHVYYALSGSSIEDPFKAMKKIHFLSGMEIPEDFKELDKAYMRFNDTFDKDKIADAVLENVK